MNIARSHLDALEAQGYTGDEARFLYIVATHSGYFMARQFLAFTGAHWGKRTTAFWNRLKGNRHVRIECFPKNGVVHHLFSRRLYRQIEGEGLRNRRAHEIDFIKGRIGILDFVLANQHLNYLETERAKIEFFCGSLNIDQRLLPAKLYVGRKTARTSLRYFADRFPMFFAPPSPVVTFTYVHNGAAPLAHFIHHLKSYLPLFRELSEFRFVYASRADADVDKATDIFDSLVKIPLESDIGDDLLRYFRVRQNWDQKQYAAVSDADLIFRNQARKRFRADRFERLYRGWKNDQLSDAALRKELGSDDKKRTVWFETFLLNRLRAEKANGERRR